MRRGCISLGNIKCDGCEHHILYPERYLAIENSDGTSQYLCTNCCFEKGLSQQIDAGRGKSDISFSLNSD